LSVATKEGKSAFLKARGPNGPWRPSGARCRVRAGVRTGCRELWTSEPEEKAGSASLTWFKRNPCFGFPGRTRSGSRASRRSCLAPRARKAPPNRSPRSIIAATGYSESSCCGTAGL
jgi:hypothetical protein